VAVKEQDIKLLWGRSGNRCAICRCELSQDKANASASFPLGEQAHIIARNSDGPRGKSILSPKERDSYHNLLLLCPNHHRTIDQDPEDYPIEKLHMIKAEHELWVQRSLSESTDSRKLSHQVIYANLIDLTVEATRLSDWNSWTSQTLTTHPCWPTDAPDRLFSFASKLVAALWPGGLEELERAIRTLSKVLNHAISVFLEHAELQNDILASIEFYHIPEWNPSRYKKLFQAYNRWVKECHALIYEATKAANWFADVVRRDINPMFFALEGKFVVTEGDYLLSSVQTTLLEYTQEERQVMPEAFTKRVNSWRRKRTRGLTS